jgi:protein-disulfide isomerase
MRFAFRHFPLTGIHPHALAAAAAAEAAAVPGRFWDMHELLFRRHKALEGGDLRGYAVQLGLDAAVFDRDRASTAVADRIRRDAGSGLASGQVLGTPTLFIDGVVHRGGYDPPALLAALADAMSSDPPSVSACTLPTTLSGEAARVRISRCCISRSIRYSRSRSGW